MWLYLAFCINYIFFKEVLEFIDIISLIPRPRSPCVAVLQASLVWTWEWDYKFMYTCQPVWAKACVALRTTVSLQKSLNFRSDKKVLPYMDNDCTIHINSGLDSCTDYVNTAWCLDSEWCKQWTKSWWFWTDLQFCVYKNEQKMGEAWEWGYINDWFFVWGCCSLNMLQCKYETLSFPCRWLRQ